MLDDSFRRDPGFRWRQSAPARLGRWLREHLRFVQAIHQAHSAVKAALEARRERAASAQAPAGAAGKGAAPAGAPQAPPAVELGVANMIYDDPTDDTWRGAWRVTETLISTINREVKEHGARFLVVTLSNPIQVHPDTSAREAFMRRLGVPDLFYPDRRFKALGDREGFAVFNLAPELQAYAEQHKVYLHGFAPDLGNGHWNERGHAVAGELLAQKLCAAAAR